MDAENLKWGQTVWDDWPREKLIREVQRMFVAVQSARTGLKFCQMNEPDSPYWRAPSIPPFDHGGTGGAALAKCEKVLESYPSQDAASENAYRCFFRYAVDLLFGREFGFGWSVCPACGTMVGANGEGRVADGRPCPDCKHKGTESLMRPLEWADLQPRYGRLPTA